MHYIVLDHIIVAIGVAKFSGSPTIRIDPALKPNQHAPSADRLASDLLPRETRAVSSHLPFFSILYVWLYP